MQNTKGLWSHIFRIAAIAAIYAALTIVCNLVEGSLSWGPIQLRLSEVLCVLDVVFGALASAIAAGFAWHHRERIEIAVAGPVIANALIIPFYLPLMLQGTGFYAIPFTEISFDGSYPLMVLFGILSIGIGEAIIMYVLGLPLTRALKGSRIAQLLAPGDSASAGGE